MLSAKEKKDWAKLLYLKTDLTQEQISEKVGVQRKTLWSWKEKENWDIHKGSLVITKEQELRRFYMQINELNTDIESREPGKRYASSKEADTLTKLSAAAKNLETETSIAQIIDVFIAFNEFIKEVDYNQMKAIVELEDAFIKTRLKRY